MPTTKITTTQKADSLGVSLRLTPSQILDIYRQVLKKKKIKDWMEEPAMLAMLEEEAAKGYEEYKKGECIPVERLK